jgi:uncharacterized protein YlzI (FlbEa/FlbD family)
VLASSSNDFEDMSFFVTNIWLHSGLVDQVLELVDALFTLLQGKFFIKSMEINEVIFEFLYIKKMINFLLAETILSFALFNKFLDSSMMCINLHLLFIFECTTELNLFLADLFLDGLELIAVIFKKNLGLFFLARSEICMLKLLDNFFCPKIYTL